MVVSRAYAYYILHQKTANIMFSEEHKTYAVGVIKVVSSIVLHNICLERKYCIIL